MSPPELTPLQKYEQFRSTHPQYKKMSTSQVCSIMVEQNLLTPAEAQELSEPLFNSALSKISQYDLLSFGYEVFGLELGESKDVSTVTPTKKQEKYHSVISSLKLTNSGTVDLNSYTLSGLKSMYPEGEYKVMQVAESNIVVMDSNNKKLLEVKKNIMGYAISFHNSDAETQVAKATPSGELFAYYLIQNNKGVKVFNEYKQGDKYPCRTSETFPDGHCVTTNYDSKSGKKKSQDCWEDGASSPSWFIEYSDGIPYKKNAKGVVEYILVNDLIKDITAKNVIGLPTTRESLSDNVLKRINYENVEETLREYEKATKRSLIEDIDNEIGLPSSERDKLINHIETLYCKNGDVKNVGDYLAKQLYDDISGIGSGKLFQHIKMLDSRNLKYVLVNYRDEARRHQSSTRFDMTRVSQILSYVSVIPKISNSSINDIADKIVPIEGLLMAISQEVGLKQEVRDNLINQIVNLMLEDKGDDVKKRVMRDINAHSEDYHKIEVDLYRAVNSNSGELRNFELNNSNVTGSENKTFSGQIKQGKTADCWLLAGLNSIINKPEMLAQLEKVVQYDSEKDVYVVNLKGANKVYKITREDIGSYSALATGSEKVNAVEIAMDKYIRDEAYENRNDLFSVNDESGNVRYVTIDSNKSRFLWNTLLGNDVTSCVIDPKTEDFNNPKRVYSTSFGSENSEVNAKSEKKDEYFFVDRHAYSIIGSDDSNVYLLNPWDSSDKITVSREDFVKLSPNIESYEIPVG